MELFAIIIIIFMYPIEYWWGIKLVTLWFSFCKKINPNKFMFIEDWHCRRWAGIFAGSLTGGLLSSIINTQFQK